jgi:IS1 family transposase
MQNGRTRPRSIKSYTSTSDSERSNLTMRMRNRRFTRLTNAFPKKFEDHAHMVAIWSVC